MSSTAVVGEAHSGWDLILIALSPGSCMCVLKLSYLLFFFLSLPGLPITRVRGQKQHNRDRCVGSRVDHSGGRHKDIVAGDKRSTKKVSSGTL